MIHLALVIDRNDGSDLEQIQTEPLQLSSKDFREFAQNRLDKEIAALEKKLEASENIVKSS